MLVVIGDNGRDGVGITNLCHKSNMPHGRMTRLVKRLIDSNLTNKIEYDGKNTYVLTEKGRLALESYKQFATLAASFGLEL